MTFRLGTRLHALLSLCPLAYTHAGFAGRAGRRQVLAGDGRLFWASVARVNLAPSMIVIPNLTVTVESDGMETAGEPVTMTCGFNLSAGSALDDASQTLSLSVVRVSNPNLFAQPPAVQVARLNSSRQDGGDTLLANISLLPAPVPVS